MKHLQILLQRMITSVNPVTVPNTSQITGTVDNNHQHVSTHRM